MQARRGVTRDQAEQWLIDTMAVSRETLSVLAELERATIAANAQQNLISKSTIEDFWSRHIVDSAQLLALAGKPAGSWIDLGSGAGFPGLIIGLLSSRPVTLVEMRRKRADHLQEMVTQFALGERVSVVLRKVEQIPAQPHAVISARAFAPLDRLFASALHLSGPKTVWILPKGRSAASELAAASNTWQGRFRIEPSVTDPEGAIIVATGVQPRRRR